MFEKRRKKTRRFETKFAFFVFRVQEQNVLLEKADAAHKLQMKAQKTAEEALNHLEIFMVEQEKLVKRKFVSFCFWKKRFFSFEGSTRRRTTIRIDSTTFVRSQFYDKRQRRPV